MKIRACAALAASAFALAGCATMVSGSSEDIAVLTPPVSATCVLSNPQGSWTVVTPTVAHVARSMDDMRIRCSKTGYREATATIPAGIAGWTMGDVIAGGPIGAAVDASTGAINQYPHSFEVPMQPLSVAGQAQPLLSKTATAPPAN